MSIIKISTQLKHIQKISLEKRKLEDSFEITFLNDGTLDMGSSFDLFDIASHHDSPVINNKYTARRNYLREKMLKHGFKDYKNEWWHYTLENEPYPDTYFNFDVE